MKNRPWLMRALRSSKAACTEAAAKQRVNLKIRRVFHHSLTYPAIDKRRYVISLISIFATGGLVAGSGGAQALGGMKVNIYNQASHTEVESRPSADGQSLEITILDVVKGGIMAGQLDRPMRQHFGASPKPQGG